MKKYIIAIDQSTSSSKVLLMDERGRVSARFSKQHRQYYPGEGMAEHDAEEIWQNVREGISAVSEGISPSQIAAISISNQRETTVFWDRRSGEPVRRAVVWQDVRAGELCRELKAYADYIRKITGIALSPYYPAAKAAHVLRSDDPLKKRAWDGEILIGTVDSYLVYRLTGGKSFLTDVTNASRTQLYDITKLGFDEGLCKTFEIPIHCLPRAVPSDALFGLTDAPGIPKGVPIIGVLGDSHASLFGQGCVRPGMTKTSYGTGSSVMMNAGKQAPTLPEGLSASIAYGFKGETIYALEGNITHSGDTLVWLCEQAELASSPAEAEKLARNVPDSGGVFLVPAFSGMGAPYFDVSARAAFIGMNRSTRREHMARAAIESMAYQNADVIRAMEGSIGFDIETLRADGGGCKNELLMQLQADLLGCAVEASDESELSALGAAKMSGLATGILSDEAFSQAKTRVYEPKLDKCKREEKMEEWRKAARRVLN